MNQKIDKRVDSFVVVIVMLMCVVVPVRLMGEELSVPKVTPKVAPPSVDAEVRRLSFEYKRSGSDEEKKAAILDEMVKLGEAGKAGALKIIDKNLEGPLNQYMKMYAKAAESVVAERMSVNAGRVMELRGQVMGLKKIAGLAKAQIVAEGDPAIKELAELLMPNRDEVVFSNFSLLGARGSVMGKASAWTKVTGKKPNELVEHFEKLAILQAMVKSPEHKQVINDNVQIAHELDIEESRGIDELNRIRILLGLNPQRTDLNLVKCSRDHSKDMVEKKFFAHSSPVSGKSTPWARAKRFNTSASAENIAAGTKSGVSAIKMWWHSPGHFKNMLGGHKRIGLGRHAKHWTQMFG